MQIESNSEAGVINYLRDFIRLESAGGILLLAATLLAMILNNSPLAAQIAPG
jgi:Na+/H+ antiporter NhaA